MELFNNEFLRNETAEELKNKLLLRRVILFPDPNDFFVINVLPLEHYDHGYHYLDNYTLECWDANDIKSCETIEGTAKDFFIFIEIFGKQLKFKNEMKIAEKKLRNSFNKEAFKMRQKFINMKYEISKLKWNS